MPCPCKQEVSSYPEIADWGPLLWKILHTLAERSGLQKDAILQGLEIRGWTNILLLLQEAIPCEKCRKHYKEWLAERPVSVLKGMPYKDVREWIREWLFSLHNKVNGYNGKPLFVFDDLATEYKEMKVSLYYKQLQPIMMRAIRLRGVPLHTWNSWVLALKQLLGIY